MLQTAKIFARRGTSNLDKSMNGLTSGEFCVLAADLKRFRTQNLTLHRQDTDDDINNGHTTNSLLERENDKSSSPLKTRSQVNSVETQSNSNSYSKNELKPTDSKAPEVFLGGSCNPTTWRADVAIPTLDKLGISFYNPVNILSCFFFFLIFYFNLEFGLKENCGHYSKCPTGHQI